MDADEYAAFKSKGRKINYCGERLAKQKINDDRAAVRKDLRPLGRGVDGDGLDLIDLVIDAIAVDVETYPSQASFGRMSRSGGGSQIISPIYEEPAEPDPWFAFEFLGALFGPPPQRVAIRAPATYRVRRPLSRKVSLKGERGRETWSIARAVPVATWACEPYCPDSPIGLRGCDLLEWLSRRVLVHVHDDHLEEFLAIKRRSGRELLGLLNSPQNGAA